MSTCPVLFYHFQASGEWYGPAHDFFNALHAAGFRGDLAVGFVGNAEQVGAAREFVSRRLLPRQEWTEVAAAERGYEQVTLEALRSWALNQGDARPVLYMHTKGAYTVSAFNDRHRRSMTHDLLYKWERCTELLADYDVVGCHLSRPGDHPQGSHLISPVLVGNFWWATAGYIKRLPELDPASDDRHEAERWILSGNPQIKDVHPGWPTEEALRGIL